MIVRSPRPDDGWVALPNQAVRDSRLSLTAIGLLCHLLSHEAGWKVSADQIARTFGIGRDRTRKAMGELIEHGYALRSRYQDTAGRWHTETVIFDRPAVDTLGEELFGTNVPTPEKPYPGSSGAKRRTSKNDDGPGFTLGDALKVTPNVCQECSGNGLRVDGLDLVTCLPCRGQGLS
jgi:hypothetical protein